MGFELNSDYVAMFEKHLSNELEKRAQKSLEFTTSEESSNFELTVIALRLLKYGRVILRRIIAANPGVQVKLYVHPLENKPTAKFKHYSAEYAILIKARKIQQSVQTFLNNICEKPPLSKFGIQPTFKFIQSHLELTEAHHSSTYFAYTHTNSHYYSDRLSLEETWASGFQLFSPIKLRVEEPND